MDFNYGTFAAFPNYLKDILGELLSEIHGLHKSFHAKMNKFLSCRNKFYNYCRVSKILAAEYLTAGQNSWNKPSQ